MPAADESEWSEEDRTVVLETADRFYSESVRVAEEKVAVAQAVYDRLDSHIIRLDAVLAKF